MNISNTITELNDLMEEFGDLNIMVFNKAFESPLDKLKKYDNDAPTKLGGIGIYTDNTGKRCIGLLHTVIIKS